jgi:hypothetical protein
MNQACNAFTLLNGDNLLFPSQHKSKDVFSRNFATDFIMISQHFTTKFVLLLSFLIVTVII